MEKISHILEGLIKKYGLEGKVIEYKISLHWKDIVGEIIASHTRPEGIRYKRLQILVDSPVWLQEISFYKQEVIERINKYFRKPVVTSVYFKIGNIEEPEDQDVFKRHM